ncbi:hypothetical protein [Halopseudomonas pertucinogena]|uniref:Secreted protein n=1 Tax=Halopseudomonas pertucinogena TaxID=86175 RepID=A0ABQ2CN18_9GAMM|nr:hypothetical protein [Halopseudomonas pertucinogena]GGI95408.1 hypothetical protein GCM10009083_09910 [Halopseudomonas pertucinogena]
MVTHLSSLVSQLLICLIGLAICVLTQFQARAADGDILISREVQPRAAARQELMPDPNPQVVNPEHSTQIRNNIRSARNPMEISDRDFANVTSGTSLGRGVQVFNQTRAQKHNNLRGAGGLGITAGAGGARAGGGTARIGNDVNRSVQQGLRPLQNLGK